MNVMMNVMTKVMMKVMMKIMMKVVMKVMKKVFFATGALHLLIKLSRNFIVTGVEPFRV